MSDKEDSLVKKPEPFSSSAPMPKEGSAVEPAALKSGFDAGELGKKWDEMFEKKKVKQPTSATIGIRG